jgi:chloride channel 3/4/5
VISFDEENTVESLRQKLERLALGLGYTDGGFPLVVGTSTTGEGSSKKQWKLVGYIAAQELEHGLNRLVVSEPNTDPNRLVCTFRHVSRGGSSSEEGEFVGMRDSMMMSMEEPSDLSVYVDKAPCTATTSSPLELVHQMFVKLGIRYLVVLNNDGSFKGLIFKKR